MNSDQALALQSALFKIATAAGGNWAPSRATIGDVSISALATIADAGTLIAELTICDREFLAYSKTASFAGLAGAAATFRVSAVASLADLEFDTIRDAFDRLRAEVHSAQLDALAKIAALRGAEAAAALH